MPFKLPLLAAAGLLALSACAVYPDYPNDKNAVARHTNANPNFYYDNRAVSHHPRQVRLRHHHMHGNHYHHDHAAYGHTHATHYDTHTGDTIIPQDKDSYIIQNQDKWSYSSCPPGAAKRGDC